MCTCVCMCACVRVCMRACVHACMYACAVGVLVTSCDLPINGGQTKIRNLGVIVDIEQDVLGLQIAMVHAVVMAVRQCLQYLREVPPRVVLPEAAALGDAVKQLAALAKLHDHVHPLCVHVYLDPQQLHDVRIVQPRQCSHLLACRSNYGCRRDLHSDVCRSSQHQSTGMSGSEKHGSGVLGCHAVAARTFARLHVLSDPYDAVSAGAKQPAHATGRREGSICALVRRWLWACALRTARVRAAVHAQAGLASQAGRGAGHGAERTQRRGCCEPDCQGDHHHRRLKGRQ